MSRESEILVEVDRELKAALSVSPSPDFEARVLRRVDDDRTPRRSPYPWLAAAAAVALAAGLFYALNRTPAGDTVAPPQMAERRADIVLPAVRPAPTPKSPDSPRVRAVSPMPGATARRREPEVIVPLNQMEVLRRLVRAVNEGRVDAPVEPPQGPIASPPELAVAPILVEPIPVPELEPDAQKPEPEIRRSY